MAYMNQERKKALVENVKKVLAEKFPDVKIKATYSVRNRSSIVMTIQECSLNLLEDMPNRDSHDVNVYHIDSHFTGRNAELLQACRNAMMVGNHDNSNVMVDYFDVAWYVDIHIGKWDKPFKVIGAWQETKKMI